VLALLASTAMVGLSRRKPSATGGSPSLKEGLKTVVKTHSFESPFEQQGRSARQEERPNKCCPSTTPGSLALALAGIAVTLRVAFTVNARYFLSEASAESSVGLFALVLLAGFTMLLVPGILVRFQATREIGFIIYHRVGDTERIKSNWENETLRSFIELGIWLGVCFGTYGVYGNPAASIINASIAGAFIALVGDYTSPYLKVLEDALRGAGQRAYGNDPSLCWGGASTDEARDELFRARQSGTLTVIMLYGYTLFTTTFYVCNDVLVTALICAAAGILLLAVARVLANWPPTYRLGRVIQDRILCTGQNWTTHPMRSALESMSWTGVTIGAYSVYGDLLVALQAGTFSGVFIAAFGELNTLGTDGGASEEPQEVRLVPLCIFGYAGLASSYYFFHCAFDLHTASLMTIAASAGYLVAGRLFMCWGPTRKAGALLQGRYMCTVANWEVYPVRSFAETAVWISVWWLSFIYTGNMVLSTPIGTLAAIIFVLLNESLGFGGNASEDDAIMIAGSPEAAGGRRPASKPSRKKNRRAGGVVHSNEPLEREMYKTIAPGLPKYTWDQLGQHSAAGDAWMAINGYVYDVTKWAPRHPGGDEIILKYAGKDGSDQFEAFHRQRVKKYLKSYLVGEMAEPRAVSKPGATEDYRKLRRKLWEEGYFEVDHEYFAVKHVVWVGFVAAAVFILFFSAWNPAVAVPLSAMALAIGLQQAAFLAHDALHNGIVEPNGKGVNLYGWAMGSPVFGISSAMWLDEHSMHHAITVRPREDPQYNMLPFFMISMKELEGPNAFQMDGFARFMVSIQHWTLLPFALLVGRVNLCVISLVYSLRHARASKQARLDIVGLIIHWSWFLAFVAYGVQTTAGRIIFYCAFSCTVGVLHVQLLLSHLATENFDEHDEQKVGFFEFQLRTSRNITCSLYEHWFHGGLEYQIEHHLFPQLPRHNLKRVKPMVEEICRKHGIEYRSTSFSHALVTCLLDFKNIAHDVILPHDICSRH
jgi:cytochrome b involved in lipid metabolism